MSATTLVSQPVGLRRAGGEVRRGDGSVGVGAGRRACETSWRRSRGGGRSGRAAAALITIAAWSALHADTDDDAPVKRSDAAARFDYLLHCSGCHRPDGSGSSPEVPSLRGPVGTLVALPEGRAYIARVPEVAQSPLDDDDLARLLNWVLEEFNRDTLPKRFRPLDGKEVGAARTRVLADPLRTRAEILGAYESPDPPKSNASVAPR